MTSTNPLFRGDFFAPAQGAAVFSTYTLKGNQMEIRTDVPRRENDRLEALALLIKETRNIKIARVCHEANRAYCKALGDNSQLPWDEAPQWQRDSAIAGVDFIRSNPDAGPSASHDSWLALKKAEGWKYGAYKDVENKLHPCFVPYEQLEPEQKAKDYIFGAIVRAML